MSKFTKIRRMWQEEKVWWKGLPKNQKSNLVASYLYFGMGCLWLMVLVSFQFTIADKTLGLIFVTSGLSIFGFLGLFGLMRYCWYLEQRVKTLEQKEIIQK